MAVTEEGKGHILYNDICGMEWGGVDIRNGGNPVVTNNWIREGHADGIVIGEGGKGVIMDNDIRGNVLMNILAVYRCLLCTGPCLIATLFIIMATLCWPNKSSVSHFLI